MISQRLRGISQEGEELEKDFVPKLKAAFGDVGISIMDQNGELRSTFDILSDLAEKWDELSSAQRQFLGEKAAGNRQVKTLNAIMQNWDVVADTIQKANEATGAAMEGNAKYMESIEGRIVQFKSAFQDLARTTINSDLVKGFVSAGTAIVKLTTDIGGLQKVLVPVIALIAIAKWNSFSNAIKKIGEAFRNSNKDIALFRTALGAAITIISTASVAWNAYISKQQEARRNTIDTSTSAIENANSIANAVSRIEQLSSITNRTADEEEEFRSAVDTVTSALGEKAAALKNLTTDSDEYLKKLKELSEEEARQAKLEAQKQIQAAREGLRTATEGLGGVVGGRRVRYTDEEWKALENATNNANYDVDKYLETIMAMWAKAGVNAYGYNPNDWVDTAVKGITQDAVYAFAPKSYEPEDIIEFLETAKAIQEMMLKRQDELGIANYLDNDVMYQDITSFIDATQEWEDSLIRGLYNAETIGKELPKTAEGYDEIANSIINATGAQNLYAEAIRSYVGQQAELAGVAATAVEDKPLESTEESAEKATASLQGLIESLYHTSDAYTALSKAISEQDKAGVISMETYQTLIEQNAEFAEYLTLTADGFALNTKSLYEYIEAQNAETKLKALEEIQDKQKALEELQRARENLTDAQKDAAAIRENESAQAAIQAEINGYAAIVREIENATGALARYNAAKSTKNQDENFNAGEQAYKDIQEGLKTGKVGTDDFKSAVGFILGENWEQELDRWGGSVENAYKEAEKLGKKYFGQEDERTGMANFRDDLVKSGYATYDKTTGKMEMLDKTTDGTLTTVENIAKSLGLSEDAVQSMFGLMETYGAEFEFPEIVTDDDLEKAKELAATIKEITEGGGEADNSSIKDLQKMKEDLEAILNSQQLALETAPEGSTAYQQAWEDINKTKEALDAVNSAIESWGENAETPLTLQEAMDKINELNNVIGTLSGTGLDIPITLSNQVDQLNELLDKLGNEDGTEELTIVINNADEAAKQVEEIQHAIDEIKANPNIPANVVTSITETGDLTIAELQNFINSGSDKPIQLTIQSLDHATEMVNDIIDAPRNDIILRVAGKDDASEEINNIVNADYGSAKVDVETNAKEAEGKIEKVSERQYGAAQITVRTLDEATSQIQGIVSEEYDPANINVEIGEDTASSYLEELTKERTVYVTVATKDSIEEDANDVFDEIEKKKQKAIESGNAGSMLFDSLGGTKLANRQVIPSDWLEDAGYEGAGKGGIATLYSSGLQVGEEGEIGVIVTPILPDGEPLEPETFDTFCEGVVGDKNGVSYEGPDLGFNPEDLIVGSIDMSSVPQELRVQYLDMLGEALHEIQEKYYDGVEKIKQPNLPSEKLKEPEPKKKKENVGKTQNGTKVAGVSTVIAADLPDKTSKEPEKIEQPVVVELVEEKSEEEKIEEFVDKAIEEAQTQASKESAEMDVETAIHFVSEAGKEASRLDKIATEAGVAEEDINGLRAAFVELSEASDALDLAEPNTEEWDSASQGLVEASQNFIAAYDNLASATGQITSITIDANTTPAVQAIRNLANQTVTVRVTPQITQFAKGTHSAPSGVSLVDEKGAELIEHTRQGTFELGTNNGARFTTLEKGDVVHTAAETRKILSRMSSIGGFFRDGLNQAKSIIGNAFATGVSGSMSWSLINKTLKKVQGSSTNTNTTTTTTKKSKKKKTSAKSLQNYAEKLFDWAEVKLERLKTITNSWLLSASEAIGYIAKNNELANAIKSVETEIENTTAAYDLYIKKADTIAKKAGLSQDIINKIQNGDISIKSYNKDMQTKIQLYSEWYEKALNCVDALTDLREQEKELITQRLDNIIDHYNYRVDRLDAVVSQREADLELLTKQGTEIQAAQYTTSIEVTTRKLEELINERTALETEFRQAVIDGFIQEESAEWYEYSGKLDEVTKAITETKTAIIELTDTANDVALTKLGWQLDALANSAESVNDFISLHTAQGVEETIDTYKTLIENGMEQIKNLERQNEEYKEQQKGLDVLSEKYQELQSNIESNTRAIMDMKVSQEEWNDAVLDLEITKLEKYRDSLSKTNDQYQRQKELQEALQELEKAQAQRTIRTYREGRGFVFEADQEAVRTAQNNLEDVIENQLIDRIDDLIDAIEEQKNNTNIYDASGNLLGSAYSTPQLAAFTDILSGYYGKIGTTSPLSSLKNALYDQLTSSISNSSVNKAVSFNVANMNINEVDNANAFAEEIIDQLPNALLQALYK